MDKTYVPAIITGVAEIFGVIVNVIVSSLLRYHDSRTKTRESNLSVLRRFYIPMCELLQLFNLLMHEYGDHCRGKKIYIYLSETENEPADLVKIVADIRLSIEKIVLFISEKDTHFFGDYKLQYFFNASTDYITNLKASSEKMTYDDQKEYSKHKYDGFRQRVDLQERKLSSVCFPHRCYLRIWRYFQDKKRI